MYADIYSLEAPLSAAPGTTVEVALNLSNDYSAPLGLRGIVQYFGPDGLLHDVAYDTPQQSSSVSPGAILPVKGHFTMPNGAVTVYGQSQYWNGGSWTAGQTQKVQIVLSQVSVTPAALSATTIGVKLVNPPAGAVSWWPVISLVSNPAEIIEPPAALGLTDSWTADLSQLGITSSGQCYINVVAYMSDGSGVGSYSVVFTAKVGDSYTFDYAANTITDTTSGGSGSSGGGIPFLKVTNSPVSGGQVDFSFSGFTPNTNVLVEVLNSSTGMAWTYVMSDSSGGGSGSFIDIDPAANYTLEAIDNAGFTSPQVPFVLGSGSSGGGGGNSTPTVKITNSPVSGGKVDFSFSGMPANTYVSFNINGGLTTVLPFYVLSDASGSGSSSFTDDDPAGTYYLEASWGSTPVQTQFALGTASGGGNTTGTGYKGCTSIVGLNVIENPPVAGAVQSTGFALNNLSSTPLELKGEIIITDSKGNNVLVQYVGANSGVVNPGLSGSVVISANFTAPTGAITITANTYYQDSTGAWAKDQTKTLTVTSQSGGGGGSSDTGGSGGSSSNGSGSSWASLIPWAIGIAVAAVVIFVVAETVKKKQPALPTGRR